MIVDENIYIYVNSTCPYVKVPILLLHLIDAKCFVIIENENLTEIDRMMPRCRLTTIEKYSRIELSFKLSNIIYTYMIVWYLCIAAVNFA
jgi:hypothetical protein